MLFSECTFSFAFLQQFGIGMFEDGYLIDWFCDLNWQFSRLSRINFSIGVRRMTLGS
jgi:hypothetical protein